MDPVEIGRQIKKAYPEYSKYPDEMLGQRYLLKNKADSVFGEAGDPVKQLAQTEARATLNQMDGADLTSKQVGAKEIIDQLFELYYGKEGEQSLALTNPGDYRLPAQLKALETKFKAGEANSVEARIYEYNRILESKRGLLARAAGDVGNLAIQEQINAGKGMPGTDSAPGEATVLFGSAYDAFAGGNRPQRLNQEISKLEQPALPTTPTTSTSPQGNAPLPPINLGGAVDQAKTALQQRVQLPKGSGELLGKLPPILGNAVNAPAAAGIASGLFNSPVGKFINPRTAKGVETIRGDQLPSIDETAGMAGELGNRAAIGLGLPPIGLAASGFGEGVTKPGASIKDRAVGGAAQGAIQGGSALALEKIMPFIRPGTAVNKASTARETVAKSSQAKFKGDELLKSAREYTKADPMATRIVDNLEPSLKGKTFSSPDLLSRLEVWNKAYNAAGITGKSSKAGVYNSLANQARNLLKTNAPDVSAAQKGLGQALGREQAMKKIFDVPSIAKGAIGTGIGVGLGALGYKAFNESQY